MVLNCLLHRSSALKRLFYTMSSKFCYEDAVQKLNALQSNKACIDQIRKDIKMGLECTNIYDMENYLQRIGIPMSKLDELSVIHVAGTKGKGSTSAMCESILRHHGYKTGFYSSPHLVAVRERIRLGGEVISKETFAKYFHEVYDLLDSTKVYEGDMPKYFAFLTVMAFNIFLREKVDVAIIEVGIGGTVDYTNVLRKVPVVGITALGLDHTSILGSKIEEIAEAKAGIMKPRCHAFTVPQPTAAGAVLRRVADDVNCSLHIAPDFNDYTFPENYSKKLPIDLQAYYTNASLSIQLAHAWMRARRIHHTNRIRSNNTQLKYETEYIEDIVTELPVETVRGLKACRWPGRYQIIKRSYADFYLDGAHTKESMDICVEWFTSHSSRRTEETILIFSATGDRDAEVLLEPLININFNTVFFVVPRAYKETNEKSDNYSNIEQTDVMERCIKHASIWKRNKLGTNMYAMECVSEALKLIKQSNDHPNILITGSLHLVGAALSILDYNLGED